MGLPPPQGPGTLEPSVHCPPPAGSRVLHPRSRREPSARRPRGADRGSGSGWVLGHVPWRKVWAEGDGEGLVVHTRTGCPARAEYREG